MTKEQKECIEMLAEQALALYSKSIELSGSAEMAKDIHCEYLKAMIYGNRKSGWML